jgi:hypothetical protein
MQTVQLKLEEDYHDRLMVFCKRCGVTKADAIRFMIDTINLEEVTDAEFDRWYDTRPDR